MIDAEEKLFEFLGNAHSRGVELVIASLRRPGTYGDMTPEHRQNSREAIIECPADHSSVRIDIHGDRNGVRGWQFYPLIYEGQPTRRSGQDAQREYWEGMMK